MSSSVFFGYEVDGVSVYGCLPDKELTDGLYCIESDAHIVAMCAATKEHKNLNILVDHTGFVKSLRNDVLVRPNQVQDTDGGDGGSAGGSGGNQSGEVQNAELDSTTGGSDGNQSCEVQNDSGEVQNEEVEDSAETDSEFYDSDYDCEDGDDDIFAAWVDKAVNDNNEHVEIVEQEDDGGLEHEDLHLTKEQEAELQYKFRDFNAEVDMANPSFKVGMVFSSMPEFRKALTTYSINERVKIHKSRNESKRLDADCLGKTTEGRCPWMIKVSEDSRRKGAITVRKYCGNHTCERVWELKVLTAPFLTQCFIEEFRDNQQMGLQTFAAKVQRKFNMSPSRFKLGRARKQALTIIHGDEAEQFSLLWDYGQELRKQNPGSKFFLSTNSSKEGTSSVSKQHLATLYWSYDGCKRGFLEGCRPMICIDGCHIKTKFKGQLLTAVGIDPNDCIFPIAMGLVEVESTSSWEWFLTTLRDDLNISNTTHFTIMSDKQKGLINVVGKIFPDAEHRFCVRHLYQNFHKKHKGETLKNDLWAIARSTSIPTW
jgi:hypothetical protein